VAFDPLDWIALADELAARSDEASHRAAIGRYYYGMFVKSLLSLEFEGKLQPTGSRADHREAVRALSGARSSAAISLNNLARLREAADYRVNPAVTAADLQRARGHAAAIQRMCAPDWAKIPEDWFPAAHP